MSSFIMAWWQRWVKPTPTWPPLPQLVVHMRAALLDRIDALLACQISAETRARLRAARPHVADAVREALLCNWAGAVLRLEAEARAFAFDNPPDAPPSDEAVVV